MKKRGTTKTPCGRFGLLQFGRAKFGTGRSPNAKTELVSHHSRQAFRTASMNMRALVNQSPRVDRRAIPLCDDAELRGARPAGSRSLLGTADDLATCLSKNSVADQVVALGSLLELLLQDVIRLSNVEIPEVRLLSLIDAANEASTFSSNSIDDIHYAQKIRNRKLHFGVGQQQPTPSDFAAARNTLLLSVVDLLPLLSEQVRESALGR